MDAFSATSESYDGRWPQGYFLLTNDLKVMLSADIACDLPIYSVFISYVHIVFCNIQSNLAENSQNSSECSGLQMSPLTL